MVVLQLHFLYLSNGKCLSQKEQTKLETKLGVVTAGGVGVDSVASSSVDSFSFLGCSCEEWFIEFCWLAQQHFSDFFNFSQITHSVV